MIINYILLPIPTYMTDHLPKPRYLITVSFGASDAWDFYRNPYRPV